jgi:uncharacterized repeat protein (TIGR03803 family)
MVSRGIVRRKNLLRCLLIASFFLRVSLIAQGQNETILYSFTGNTGTLDGSYPQGRLVMDGSGNLYGATYYGGANGAGTVFKLTPSGTEKILHSFANDGTDGFSPTGGLVLDSQGNLYGLTFSGLNNGQSPDCGTVFKVTPSGVETVLHAFAGNPNDGCDPQAGLISDSQGNLYGTTEAGGTSNCGTVFEVTPVGVENVLYSFASNNIDGCGPMGDLVFDGQGNIYGTTDFGGTGGCTNPFSGIVIGCGTVFKLTPSGVETVLHSFAGGTKDGSYPTNSDLAIDKAGNLYGTALEAGAFGNWGTVFKITPTGTETLLHSFDCCGFNATAGAGPLYGVVRDAAGNLYGTTSVGTMYGSEGLSNSSGGVFQLTTSGLEVALHNFPGYPDYSESDGDEPSGNLIMDKEGNLYGVTSGGGTTFGGAVYEIYRAGSTATTTTLTSSENPSHYYDFVTITATVSSAQGSVPDGELVTFNDGENVLIATPLAGGVATYSTYMVINGSNAFVGLPLGSNAITALYTGDATFKSSQGTITQVVDKYSTTTVLSTSVNPSSYGETLTLTAQVTNGAYPTGIVTFYNGPTKLGAVQLGPTYAATLKTATLPLGTDALTAIYSGDGYNLGSASSPITQVVNQAKIRIELSSSPNPSTSGETVQFTATLASTGGLPTGVVTFSYDGTTLGTGTISGREAIFSTNTLPVGADVVEASYTGNADYSSASATITQTVDQ